MIANINRKSRITKRLNGIKDNNFNMGVSANINKNPGQTIKLSGKFENRRSRRCELLSSASLPNEFIECTRDE